LAFIVHREADGGQINLLHVKRKQKNKETNQKQTPICYEDMIRLFASSFHVSVSP